MARDPDDIFGPDEDIPEGEVIELVRKDEFQKAEGGIDFDSDKPLIIQAFERHELDRTDKTEKGCFGKAVFLIGLFLSLILLIAFVLARLL